MEAIGLNPIRLDAIGIDPIRLNAIRLGVPGASSGSNRPYIDPDVLASLVAVCICDGKSNNDPDRAIIKNLVDPANPFVISNAAYKLNSGFGKYEEDFTDWKSASNINLSSDGTKISTISTNFSCQYNYSSIGRDVPSFKVKISNFTEGTISYYYREEDGNEKHINFGPITVANSNGIIELPKSYNTVENGIGYRGGFIGIQNTNIGLTIEQIPSFQGALVTDGVNDLITSSKTVQEMLGGSTELTVVTMMCNLTNDKATYNNQIRPYVEGFIRTRFIGNSGGKLSISGYTIKNINYNASIPSSNTTDIKDILGDKNDFGREITNGKLDGVFSVEGYHLNNGTIYELSQVAWYWTFIAKRALTTDEFNQVIAYYNLDKYVKPDIYYDVKKQGLTNDTPDADWYLKDFSGNGHDMQLYNYGKTPESGINEEGGLQSDGVTDYGKAENLPIYKDYTVVADREWASSDPRSMILASKTNGVDNGAFLFEDFEASAVNRAYSFGTATSVPIDKNRIISYQSKYLYNKTSIGIGTTLDGNVLCLCRGRDLYPFYANAAIWSFLLFPYTLSDFLLERQLKRYKLGTLYPDMVEFRPIVKSNVEYELISFATSTSLIDKIVTGDYMKLGTLYVYVKPKSDNDRVVDIRINGIPAKLEMFQSNGQFRFKGEVSKSPQKIDITIDEYIRYEDIVQPYPAIINLKQDGKTITWGDKLKVGSEVTFVNHTNLLPDLYTIGGGVQYNGTSITWNTPIRVEKSMVFTNIHGYKKDNEPNCILSPQTLRIPNASYKILGYIPDLTGKGNHGKINNSAYAGMSGANGYSEDFTSWLHQTEGTLTDSKFKATGIASTRWVLYKSAGYNFPTNTYIVTGIPNDVTLTYNDGTNIVIIENRVPFTISAYSASSATGFVLSKGVGLDLTGLIIEQIGKYEGSFCLDGIEDFLTIPTLSHGAKQILMKVNWQTDNTLAYDQRVTSGYPYYFAIYTSNEGSTIAYNPRNTNGKTYIDGVLNSAIFASQLKGITHNITITNNDVTEDRTTSPVIGSGVYHNGFFTKMALFTFMSFDEISSEDEIKELNDIVGIEGGYVESPDYYWDAYGKNNLATLDIDYQDLFQSGNANKMLIDKSKAGLAALDLYHNSGNNSELINRRLTANNFAFNEESGYGGQKLILPFTKPYTSGWNYTEDRVSFEPLDNRNSVRITEVKSGVALFWAGKYTKIAYYKVTGVSTGKGIKFGSDSSSAIWSKVAEEDGIYEVDWSLNVDSSGTVLSTCILSSGFRGECDIVIEQVSQYPNGLVSDGVEDNLKNTNMPVLTDYTWIMKRKRLNDKSSTTLCHKGNGGNSNAFLFEYIEGGKATRSFGLTTPNIIFPDLISYQTKNSYNGQTINSGTSEDGNVLHIFMGSNVYPYYTKAVFYKAMLYSKTIDQLSINMLKNLFAKDELIDVNNPIFKK